jgi:hypothetical protein
MVPLQQYVMYQYLVFQRRRHSHLTNKFSNINVLLHTVSLVFSKTASTQGKNHLQAFLLEPEDNIRGHKNSYNVVKMQSNA